MYSLRDSTTSTNNYNFFYTWNFNSKLLSRYSIKTIETRKIKKKKVKHKKMISLNL